MTVRQLAKELAALKPELQDIEVKTLFPNGEMLPGDIKFVLKEKYSLHLTKENVEYITLA